MTHVAPFYAFNTKFPISLAKLLQNISEITVCVPGSDSIIMLFRGQATVIVFVYNQANWSVIKVK